MKIHRCLLRYKHNEYRQLRQTHPQAAERKTAMNIEQWMDRPGVFGPFTPRQATAFLKDCAIPNLIFDVDDTLYYRSAPYFKAYERSFPEGTPEECARLYEINKVVKEENFHRMMRGEITMRELEIDRTKRTFAKIGVKMSDEEALAFEAQYAAAQNEITLSPDFRDFFEWCRKNRPDRFLGIMTNGRHERQWNKIKKLGLKQYVPVSHIYVSEDGGASKPDIQAFRLYEQQTGVKPSDTILVGDSLDSDVKGAVEAGWQVLYVTEPGFGEQS